MDSPDFQAVNLILFWHQYGSIEGLKVPVRAVLHKIQSGKNIMGEVNESRKKEGRNTS